MTEKIKRLKPKASARGEGKASKKYLNLREALGEENSEYAGRIITR